MDPVLKDRKGNIITPSSEDGSLSFLYRNPFGRMCLKLVNRRFTAKLVGRYMDSRLSARRIEKFVKANNIDMSLYEDREFKSYNDFFTRKLRPEYMEICADPDALISPCDSKLTVYQLNGESVFFIKGAPYSLPVFLQNEQLAREFEGGHILVFRLSVDNYHRYCYFDSGTKGENVHIKGVLHTVKAISLEKYNYYHQNSREYTVMQTERFGKAIQAEIGAMLVGKIKNLSGECSFVRGEEKGMFEFGGSTVAVVLKKGAAVIDADILKSSAEGAETAVRIGERIGAALREGDTNAI